MWFELEEGKIIEASTEYCILIIWSFSKRLWVTAPACWRQRVVASKLMQQQQRGWELMVEFIGGERETIQQHYRWCPGHYIVCKIVCKPMYSLSRSVLAVVYLSMCVVYISIPLTGRADQSKGSGWIRTVGDHSKWITPVGPIEAVCTT